MPARCARVGTLPLAPTMTPENHTPEFRDLPPLIGAGGTVRLPGSKSISNRVLLLAALAEGQTEITGLLDSDDTLSLIHI